MIPQPAYNWKKERAEQQSNTMSEICDECKKVLPNIEDNAALDAMAARAQELGHCICLHVLQKAGAQIYVWKPLRLAAHLNHVECMKSLIEAGADVSHYIEGIIPTAVYEAAGRGHEECVQILIKSRSRCEEWCSL